MFFTKSYGALLPVALMQKSPTHVSFQGDWLKSDYINRQIVKVQSLVTLTGEHAGHALNISSSQVLERQGESAFHC